MPLTPKQEECKEGLKWALYGPRGQGKTHLWIVVQLENASLNHNCGQWQTLVIEPGENIQRNVNMYAGMIEQAFHDNLNPKEYNLEVNVRRDHNVSLEFKVSPAKPNFMARPTHGTFKD